MPPPIEGRRHGGELIVGEVSARSEGRQRRGDVEGSGCGGEGTWRGGDVEGRGCGGEGTCRGGDVEGRGCGGDVKNHGEIGHAI
ncbi:unnamed protein product [Closterium sp. Naga37s-1]|nr:unnamed protein product [Closterium sp. Naga37s-1]